MGMTLTEICSRTSVNFELLVITLSSVGAERRPSMCALLPVRGNTVCLLFRSRIAVGIGRCMMPGHHY